MNEEAGHQADILEPLLSRVRELGEVRTHRGEESAVASRQFADHVEQLLTDLPPLVIAVVGEFRCGKSTLLNALMSGNPREALVPDVPDVPRAEDTLPGGCEALISVLDEVATAALISRSSLGTPAAEKIRRMTSLDNIAAILRRRDQLQPRSGEQPAVDVQDDATRRRRAGGVRSPQQAILADIAFGPDTMTCTEVTDRAGTYLDRETDDEVNAKIREHLYACEDCLREYSLKAAVRQLVQKHCGRDHAPADLEAKIMTRIRTITGQPEPGPRARHPDRRSAITTQTTAQPDTFGEDLRPDLSAAKTAAELMEALRQYRFWAGTPSFRHIARHSGNAAAASTICSAMNTDTLPRLETAVAIVAGCGGSQEDQQRVATAWRKLWRVDTRKATQVRRPKTPAIPAPGEVEEEDANPAGSKIILEQDRELEQARRAIGRLQAEIVQMQNELESTRAAALGLAELRRSSDNTPIRTRTGAPPPGSGLGTVTDTARVSWTPEAESDLKLVVKDPAVQDQLKRHAEATLHEIEAYSGEDRRAGGSAGEVMWHRGWTHDQELRASWLPEQDDDGPWNYVLFYQSAIGPADFEVLAVRSRVQIADRIWEQMRNESPRGDRPGQRAVAESNQSENDLHRFMQAAQWVEATAAGVELLRALRPDHPTAVGVAHGAHAAAHHGVNAAAHHESGGFGDAAHHGHDHDGGGHGHDPTHESGEYHRPEGHVVSHDVTVEPGLHSGDHPHLADPDY